MDGWAEELDTSLTAYSGFCEQALKRGGEGWFVGGGEGFLCVDSGFGDGTGEGAEERRRGREVKHSK